MKLNLLKKSYFLTRTATLDLYFKIILQSVTYGILIWGNCNNMDNIKTIEALIYNLPWDTPSETVTEVSKWDSIFLIDKQNLIKLFYNIFNNKTPASISDIAVWRKNNYNLRGRIKDVAPRFNSYYMKNSISYRGAVLWNIASIFYSINFKQFCSKVKRDNVIKELDVNSLSIQTQLKIMPHFKFY